jgi:acetyl esterase
VLAALALRAGEFGIDPNRLAFAGCSSGANLMLAAFLSAPLPNYRVGALFYGSYGSGDDTASMREFADGRYGMGAAEIAWCWKNYAGDPAARRDPRACPSLADLSRTPPLFLAAAELDPLRDDSVALAARLASLGRAHRLEIYAGMGHSFLGYERLVPRARDTIRDAAAYLNSHLGASP